MIDRLVIEIIWISYWSILAHQSLHGALPSCTLFHVSAWQLWKEVNTLPILQMRTLRLREVFKCAQLHFSLKKKKRTQKSSFLSTTLIIYQLPKTNKQNPCLEVRDASGLHHGRGGLQVPKSVRTARTGNQRGQSHSFPYSSKVVENWSELAML